MDILKAEQEITALKEAVQGMQVNIERSHNDLYEEAVKLSEKIGIVPTRPSIVQRQIHRRNAPATFPEDYCRINLTIVFLDHVLKQLNSRFPSAAYTCFKVFSVVPSVMLANLPTWRSDVEALCDHYSQNILVGNPPPPIQHTKGCRLIKYSV